MKVSRCALFLILLLPHLALADDYTKAIETWRAERVARLTAADSWLSLIGLPWLKLGDNTMGSAADNSLRLAAGPAHLGTVRLDAGDKIFLTLADGVDATIDGKKVPAAELIFNARQPTLVRSGTVSFFVIQRGDKLGLRVRDSESPRRKNFLGLDYFPIDPAWRIEAQWVPFAPPHQVPITNILGQTSPESVPGKAVFTHDGRTLELLPIDEGDGKLFFIISDATSGDETYGAARFFYADAPKDGKVILDLNRAYSPPCAFTPFATCPLPPKENRLPFPVRAGEKKYRGEHH